MRIIAGVFLLLASLVNGCSGCSYVAGGALTSGVGSLSRSAATSEFGQQVGSSSALERDGRDLGVAGGALSVFGYFLLLLVGLQIAAAVGLFARKLHVFILLVAALGLAAEAAGIYFAGFGVSNLMGLVGSALAIPAAIALAKPSVAAADSE
jgi:hypothetical protein